MSETKKEPWMPNNCPIIEQTGDGRYVGRCLFFLADGRTCQRHGDVSGAVERHKATGRLTTESDHKAEGKG